MADQYMSMDNLRFLLHEVHQFKDIAKTERYQTYDPESADMILAAYKDLADQEFFPCFTEMDAHGVRYENGRVIVPPQIESIIQKAAEMGFIGCTFSEEDGGLQIPKMLYNSINHILESANNSAIGYLNLTTGSANLIVTFGSEELKETYVPNMIEGKWMGTMALTEPQAGSSLSDITTAATPREDGNYDIAGQKIFISGGDHQFAENFVHLTLARIEGAPLGTKGISLFVVPQKRPTTDGDLTDNDVAIAGDFQKVGQKGYATTHLVYGEQQNCVGYLVGKPNMGLKYMFQMMNEARIDVGLMATSTATAAYHASLQYARERPQGRKLTSTGQKDASQEQTLIINHPDVRRMLLLQKAITEGALSLLLECARIEDLHKTSEGEASKNYHRLLEILTPIAKTYPSEMGQVSISNGLQILGGYGFCMDFPLQQYYRDIRIMSLYEGTTGIQSLDLLGRKISAENGLALKLLLKEMQKTIMEASTYGVTKPYSRILGEKLGVANEVLNHLMGFAKKGNFERFLSDATIFMQMMSNLVIGWQWIKQAIVAHQLLMKGGSAEEIAFYESKIHTMKFFFKYEMSKINGWAEVLMSDEVLTIIRDKEPIV